MAEFRVTAAAVSHIRAEIEKWALQSPLVGVCWMSQQADLIRTPEGQTAWTYEGPHWIATVLDLEEIGDWPGEVIEIQGLKFSLRGSPEFPALRAMYSILKTVSSLSAKMPSNWAVNSDALRRPGAARLPSASRRLRLR